MSFTSEENLSYYLILAASNEDKEEVIRISSLFYPSDDFMDQLNTSNDPINLFILEHTNWSEQCPKS